MSLSSSQPGAVQIPLLAGELLAPEKGEAFVLALGCSAMTSNTSPLRSLLTQTVEVSSNIQHHSSMNGI